MNRGAQLAIDRVMNILELRSIATWAVLLCASGNIHAQMWDVLPTPLDVMEEAGIERDPQSIQAVLLDSERDPELRFKSALALAQLQDRESVAVLIKVIDDNEPRARQGAITALMFMPSIDAIPKLCSMVHSAWDGDTRRYAVNSLSQIDSSLATQCIVDAAANENESIQTRRAALHVLLGVKKNVESVDGLVPLLESPDTILLALAALCLNRSYYQSKAIHKSLRITDALVSSALDRELNQVIYFDVIKALELVSGQTFIDPSIRREAGKELLNFLDANRFLVSEDVRIWSEGLER